MIAYLLQYCSLLWYMISIFPLWTFHLYVATFHQHLHMEYVSLSWTDIPELVVPIRIFYGGHHDLVNHYGTSVSQMSMDMFHFS